MLTKSYGFLYSILEFKEIFASKNPRIFINRCFLFAQDSKMSFI